jgi:hypothetical protein
LPFFVGDREPETSGIRFDAGFERFSFEKDRINAGRDLNGIGFERSAVNRTAQALADLRELHLKSFSVERDLKLHR